MEDKGKGGMEIGEGGRGEWRLEKKVDGGRGKWRIEEKGEARAVESGGEGGRVQVESGGERGRGNGGGVEKAEEKWKGGGGVKEDEGGCQYLFNMQPLAAFFALYFPLHLLNYHWPTQLP